MTGRAKIFYNGGSQSVRLPKSCRFPEDQQEVVARRVGRKVILEPADEWSSDFIGALGSWSGEIERPATRPIGRKKDPFADVSAV
jgi:virulence-associated protein VagC